MDLLIDIKSKNARCLEHGTCVDLWLVYLIAMINRFAYSKGLTNAEYVHMNKECVLPEDIGFSPDYSFLVYTNIGVILESHQRKTKRNNPKS